MFLRVGGLKLKQLGEGGTQLLDAEMIPDCAKNYDSFTLQNHANFNPGAHLFVVYRLAGAISACYPGSFEVQPEC
jgi:hypothetical protein